MRFIDLSVTDFKGATVLLDIDGTLMEDKGERMEQAIEHKVRNLAEIADVYLASNGHGSRTERLARELGINFLPRLRKPLSHRAIRMLQRKERTFVIGDKFLTDRILALRIGAEFVQVERLRSHTDILRTRIAYGVDDLALYGTTTLRLLRPHQWVKNLLVFAPLFFAQALFVPGLLSAAVIAFIAFSIAASTVYIFNDLRDRVEDREHPVKRHRPIASGRITVRTAIGLLTFLLVAEITSLIYFPVLAPVLLLYLVINFLYTIALKRVPIVDILVVAACYILRLEAGSVATNIPLSPWILLCVFFVSLFVIIGKRRAEFSRTTRRKVLDSYTKEALDAMLAISAGLAIISYALYTLIGHSAPYLIYSTVFVVAALLRTLNDIHSPTSRAESPDRLLFKDPWILASFVAWAAYLFFAFYAI